MTRPGTNRRLAAIVAADVVGYSRLMGLDEEGTLNALKAHRKDVIGPLVRRHKGHLVKTAGDGLLLEFPSVVQAVACAVEVQTKMAERAADVPADRRILFRVGVNLGDIIIEDADVFGDGVNIAARLEQIARPGEICISEAVYRQIEGKLDLEIQDGGARRLKNIKRPVRIYHVVTSSPAAGFRGRALRVLRGRRWRGPAVGGALALAAALAFAAFWYAGELMSGLDQARETARTPARGALPVIAVLPFANQTGDKEREYIADGFTEELIGALGRFNTLRVIGRNAVAPYKVRNRASGDIASKLGATYIVEGGLRSSKDRLRVAARLTDAQNATVLWSDQFDGTSSDIFRFQDAISRRIAGTLAANITQLEGQRSRDRAKPKPSAHDLMLQARALGYGGSREKNRRFRELLERAIKIDPDYATARALMAEAIYARIARGWAEFAAKEAEQGERYARQAVALAPNEPDGYRALGRFHLLRAEYDQALHELERAVELNPSDSTVLAMWGAVRLFTGDAEGAIEVLELALKYDPALEPFHVFDLSLAYYFAHRDADALRIAERGIARFPDFANFHVPAAAAAARLGKKDRAARHVGEIRKRLPFLDLDSFGTRFRDPAHLARLREGLRQAGL